MKYRKKPVVVEAFRLGIDDFPEWFLKNNYDNKILSQVAVKNGCLIRTLEGDMLANPGNYIIKGIKGEIYPCKQDIFEATYELVENSTDE